VRDHCTAVIYFVQKRWLAGFTVTFVVTYSETGIVKFEDASVSNSSNSSKEAATEITRFVSHEK